jgi:hypothetical protein
MDYIYKDISDKCCERPFVQYKIDNTKCCLTCKKQWRTETTKLAQCSHCKKIEVVTLCPVKNVTLYFFKFKNFLNFLKFLFFNFFNIL